MALLSVWIDFLFTSGEGNAREWKINENACLSEKSFESFQILIFPYLWGNFAGCPERGRMFIPEIHHVQSRGRANLHFKSFFHVLRLLMRPKLFLMKNCSEQAIKGSTEHTFHSPCSSYRSAIISDFIVLNERHFCASRKSKFSTRLKWD